MDFSTQREEIVVEKQISDAKRSRDIEIVMIYQSCI